MNLDNITKGIVIKNYKELCRILELDVKSGRAKKNQLEWVQDYIKYDKEGHKFIVKDVYDIEVQAMPDNRGGDMSDNTHIEYIEKLILDLLAYNESKIEQKGKGRIFLSKTKMFEALAMVNSNYAYSSSKPQRVSNFMDINDLNVEEWFNSTSSMLERNLNKALNNLEKQYLIYWSKKIAICKLKPSQDKPNINSIDKVDRYGDTFEVFEANVQKNVNREYREATEDEIHCIIKAEREIMEDIGCKNQQDIFIQGKWNTFQNRVKDIIRKESNIGFYWQSYHIIFNHENVHKEANNPNRMLLTSEDEIKYQRLLNKAIQDNSNKNGVKRHERAKATTESETNSAHYRNKRRSEDSYVKNILSLSDTMINKETPDLIEKIKKSK